MRLDLLWGGAVEQSDHYLQIQDFVRKRGQATYSQFDSYIFRDVNLFALPEDFDFEAFDEILNKIIAALPAIKRIFAKPVTHIKNYAAVLPVEVVRSINSQTISYAAVHSELWEDITEEGLKPRKLLTQDHQDNYITYENLVLVDLVDKILSFVGKSSRFFKRALYASQDLSFNLLERENHLSYFLAIGKLHAGYARGRDEFCVAAELRLDRLLFIERTLKARLNSPVYKRCRGKCGTLTLKKTNVFRMHKDYHRIYVLLKWLLDEDRHQATLEGRGVLTSAEGYLLYCSLLSLFAIGHFNFVFDDGVLIDFRHMNVRAAFGPWEIKLETVACEAGDALRFTFFKDVSYKILLLPAICEDGGLRDYECLCEKYGVQECLCAYPDDVGGNAVLLSLFDIESFRRVQQILLRGMIYSDQKRDICPFCGKPLEQNELEASGSYECRSCRTQIFSLCCPETGEPYFATGIKTDVLFAGKGYGGSVSDGSVSRRFGRAQMYFRNITALGKHGEFICPQCGRIHV